VWLSHTQLASASVPDLIGFLASPHELIRSQAARELVNRKEQPAVAWPGLLAARADGSWVVRMQVPRAAVHLGVAPEEAVPVLESLLDDPSDIVRGYAAWALERFGRGTQADILAELVRQGRHKPPEAKAGRTRRCT
jgi:HEAT repeat protein